MMKHLANILISGSALALATGAYAFWYHQVEERSLEAATLRAEIEARGEAGSRIAQARKELDAIAHEEASVYAYFVSPENVVSFLESLEATGTGLGSTVEVVSVANGTGAQQGSLNVSLRITGSFDTVLRTVGAIEYQPYHTRLMSLTLDTPRTGTGETWTAAASFLVGMTPQPPAATTTKTQ